MVLLQLRDPLEVGIIREENEISFQFWINLVWTRTFKTRMCPACLLDRQFPEKPQPLQETNNFFLGLRRAKIHKNL